MSIFKNDNIETYKTKSYCHNMHDRLLKYDA